MTRESEMAVFVPIEGKEWRDFARSSKKPTEERPVICMTELLGNQGLYELVVHHVRATRGEGFRYCIQTRGAAPILGPVVYGKGKAEFLQAAEQGLKVLEQTAGKVDRIQRSSL